MSGGISGLAATARTRASAVARSVALEVGAGLAAAILAISGGGFLCAAGYQLLAREIGPIAAAAMIGLLLLALAGGVMLLRASQRRTARHQELAQAIAATQARTETDPLQTLVFDLSYLVGHQMRRRR